MNIFVSVIICFLALYGFADILYKFALFIAKGKDVDIKKVHRVIIVDNSSYNLESYVRYLALICNGESLILLNKTSDEEILNTAWLLESEFNFVKVMEEEAYIKYLSEI